MNRRTVGIGAILAGLSVALGAFGAHGLKERFAEGGEAWWQTGTQYMVIHALAMVAVGMLGKTRGAAWCFGLGMVFFSGSLCTMALTGIRVLGAITPIGGALFLVGWGLFAWSALKADASPE